MFDTVIPAAAAAGSPRRSRVRQGAALAAALLTSLQLTACGDDRASTGPGTAASTDPGATVSIPASQDPLDVSGLIWSSGSVVHLADGTEVELGEEPYRYAVGGDGVFFTTESSGVEEGAVENHAMYYADRDGEVRQVADGVGDPWISPDGRHVVYLDLATGDPDAYGTPQAQMVVVDLVTGEEVVRSTEGAGDPETDDFADSYADGEIRVRRVTDDQAWVTLGATQKIDLATGEIEQRSADDTAWDVRPGDPESPDGAWRFVGTDDVRDRLVGPGGQEVVPQVDAARWALRFWADDRTIVGWSIDGPVGPASQPFSAADTYELMSCTVPSGACEQIPGTAGETVRFPTGDTETGEVTLAYAG